MATDWIEDFVLRYGGPEKYDQWVKHEIPFTDPVVVQAGQEFEKLALADGNVFGGRKGVVSTNFGTAASTPCSRTRPSASCTGRATSSPRRASSPRRPAPTSTKRSACSSCRASSAANKPVLGGGDLAGAFSNDADIKTALEFMTSPDFKFANIAASSYMSPHKTFDVSQYPDETTKKIAEGAYASTVFRFDGSDLMPGAVGAGSFWKGMTAWISGQQNLDETLKNIDESWPS